MTRRRAGRRPRVLFRVAAGPRIGFGHLMRCRALANALGVPALLSIRGRGAAQRIACALGWRLLRGRSSLRGADLLVVDDPHPSAARAWLGRGARAGLATVAVQDGGAVRAGSRLASLIVDGSVSAGGLQHPRRRRNAARASGRPAPGPVRLLGTRYTLLDRRVIRARAARSRRARSRRPRILIALGGGSQLGPIVRPLVRAIARVVPSAAIRVAAGFSCRTRRLPRGAIWVRPSGGLTRELAACDAAIVAGGVTLYEACAIGVPAAALAVVPAQRRAVQAFARRGAVIDAGSAFAASDAPERAARALARLLNEDEARRRAAAARKLVDGRGALRVAARIRQLRRSDRHA